MLLYFSVNYVKRSVNIEKMKKASVHLEWVNSEPNSIDYFEFIFDWIIELYWPKIINLRYTVLNNYCRKLVKWSLDCLLVKSFATATCAPPFLVIITTVWMIYVQDNENCLPAFSTLFFNFVKKGVRNFIW